MRVEALNVRLVRFPGDTVTPAEFNCTYDLQTFDAVAPSALALDAPPRCTLPPALCNATDPVSNQTQFLVHPLKFTGQLDNQDTGDLVGDTAFLCFFVNPYFNTSIIPLPPYDAMSQFRIEVDSRYGPYQFCNSYQPAQCFGTLRPSNAVGREVALGAATAGGQCANNSAQGSWYSLPASGGCGSRPIGEGGCTWRVLARVKTLLLDCLLNLGLRQVCDRDGAPPFARAQQLIARAFASTDAARGGCPSANVTDHKVLLS